MVNRFRLKATENLSIKDQIRFLVFPKLAYLMNRLGWGYDIIGGTKISNLTLIPQAKSIINRSIGQVEQASEKLKIVFLTMLGGHVYNASIEAALAVVLKARGHKVKMVIDDQSLPISQEIIVGKEHLWTRISARNYEFAKRYLGNLNLDLCPISFYSSRGIEIDFNDYRDILHASLLRHYKVGYLRDDLPGLGENRCKAKQAIQISAKVGVGIAEEEPDLVIMSHGIYSTWGPAFRVLREKNIDVLTHGRGKRSGTGKFNWNVTADWWDIEDEWKKREQKPLTTEERSAITTYLKSRVDHSEDVFVYNFGEYQDRQQTYKRFDLDPNKITYSLFTNVLWDAASTQREIAFRDPIEWVVETIKWIKGQKDKQLIIKIHPAELVIGTQMPFKMILDTHLKEVPANVRVIEPQEKVNSWSIYGITDLGLVHTTTVGMELPLQGTPCAVVSRTHYRAKGFTIDIDSRQEYFDVLNNFNTHSFDRQKIKELSLKYAYILFEKYQMPLNLFHEKESTDVRSLRFNSVSDLLNNRTIMKVIECIETKRPSILN